MVNQVNRVDGVVVGAGGPSTGGLGIYKGFGVPGVAADTGSIYVNLDPVAPAAEAGLWIKESSPTPETGWVRQ